MKLLNKNKIKILLSLIVFTLFIVIVYFVYKKYIFDKIKPKYVENKEFIGNKKQDYVELYFFYTDSTKYQLLRHIRFPKFGVDHIRCKIYK